LNIKFIPIIYIVIASSLLGLIINFISPNGISLIKAERVLNFVDDSLPEPDNGNIPEETNTQNNALDEAKAITLKQAYSLFNQDAIFIDARDYVEYEIGHISGAITLPYEEFEKYKSVLQSISKDTPLVTYCDGADCDLSILLGDKLFEMGYKQVYIFFGGWIDWQENNYPIESLE
jgi:rhodanese-related sulfurtransferase